MDIWGEGLQQSHIALSCIEDLEDIANDKNKNLPFKLEEYFKGLIHHNHRLGALATAEWLMDNGFGRIVMKYKDTLIDMMMAEAEINQLKIWRYPVSRIKVLQDFRSRINRLERNIKSAKTIKLTNEELIILNNALNEVLHGVEVPGFHSRIGGTAEEAIMLLDRINSIINE